MTVTFTKEEGLVIAKIIKDILIDLPSEIRCLANIETNIDETKCLNMPFSVFADLIHQIEIILNYDKRSEEVVAQFKNIRQRFTARKAGRKYMMKHKWDMRKTNETELMGSDIFMLKNEKMKLIQEKDELVKEIMSYCVPGMIHHFSAI